MEKIKKFIKNHKIITALIIMFILAIILFIILYNIMFVYREDKRMSGKEEVVITKESLKTIENNLAKKDEFNTVSINLVTRQISFLIDVKEDTDKKYAKEISSDVLNELSDKEKSYYDVQIIYTCEKCDKEDTTYPIIGYKNKTVTDIVWSNN